MALHGWSAANRYLLEPAAVTVVLAGNAIGRVLALGAQPTATTAADVASGGASIPLVVLLAATLRRPLATARGPTTVTSTRHDRGHQIGRFSG